VVWLSPNFQRPLEAKLCQIPKSFRGARTCSRSSITMQVWWGSDFTRRRGGQKRWVFLSVCLSVRHAFERQRLCAWFCHGGVGVGTKTILMPLDSEGFVVVQPYSAFWDWCQLATSLNAEVQKTAKMGFIAATGRHSKPIESKFRR